MRGDDVFEAIANPTRRALLDLLRVEPQPVNDLAERFDVHRASISEHLKVLRDAGLVTSDRQGRQRIYRLDPEPLEQLAVWLHPFEAFWSDRTSRLRSYLDQNSETS